VISHERGEENGIATTTNGAYKWSSHFMLALDISDSTVYIGSFKVK